MTMTTNYADAFGINEEVLAMQQQDTTESEGGNFESLLKAQGAAGACVLRLVSYIETGQHTSTGKFAKTSQNAILEFEVLTPKHTKEIEKDGVKTKITETIRVYLRKGTHPKSGYMQFFKRMDYGRGLKSFAQMLGNAFRAEILHTLDETGKITKATIHDGENTIYTIGAPVVEQFNDMGESIGTKQINVPEHTKPIRCLLWAAPNKAMWDSIFIDGTYKKKEGDKEVEVSKNWIQETCLEAEDFNGSPLQALLGGTDDLPGMSGTVHSAQASASDLDALGGL